MFVVEFCGFTLGFMMFNYMHAHLPTLFKTLRASTSMVIELKLLRVAA